jgi:hypothetical protein
VVRLVSKEGGREASWEDIVIVIQGERRPVRVKIVAEEVVRPGYALIVLHWDFLSHGK